MIAVVLVSPFSPIYAVLGLAVIIAAAVLAAHWGAYRPQVKRLIAVSLMASVLVATWAPAVHAEDDDFVFMNPCDKYPPWSGMWIYHLCMLPRRTRRLPLVRRPR